MPDLAINSKKLKGKGQLGPFPLERLKQVDKPTTLISDGVQRIDSRQRAMARAQRGDYGPVVQKLNAAAADKKGPLTNALVDLGLYISGYGGSSVGAEKASLAEPNLNSRHIKSLGYFMGADCMGICRFPATAAYSFDAKGEPVNITYKYAIVILASKHYPTIAASTGFDWVADPLSFGAYVQSAMISEGIANYIRRLGYPASTQHGPGHYQVLMPPLVIWSGLGEGSRLGIAVNPFLGPDFKAAAVLTDLPLEPDKPIDFGLQDFCKRCKRCAELCPAKAISTGNKVMYNGYETWKHDDRRCVTFTVANEKGNFCTRCIKVCPWTRPNTRPHQIVRWAAMNSKLGRTLAIKGDRLLAGHTRPHPEEKWWFDLIYKDGKVERPE